MHLAHIGHPLLGDMTYGAGFKASARKLPLAAQAALEELGRQALHAAELAFEHPVTRQRLGLRPAPAGRHGGPRGRARRRLSAASRLTGNQRFTETLHNGGARTPCGAWPPGRGR